MAEVIGLEEKKKRKQKRSNQDQARKALAFLKVFECASCYLKCTRCGTRLEPTHAQSLSASTPHPFCDTCHEEFSEFQRRLSGGRNTDFYWYNDEWLNMWKAWTNYQDAVERYLNSKEAIRLRYELRRR